MRDDYKSWLKSKGYADVTYFHDAKRIEDAYGNLEDHFTKGTYQNIIDDLKYSKSDEQNNLPNPSKLGIKERTKLRDLLSAYRSVLKNYELFLKEQGVSSSPKNFSRKQFMESVGATCKNWYWSWSFINEKEKFIVFGCWDSSVEKEEGLIFDSKEWKTDAKGKKTNGYKQSLEHIRLIEEEGYALKTFSMHGAVPEGINGENGVPEIKSFTPELINKNLFKSDGRYYALDYESLPKKTHDEYEKIFQDQIKKSKTDTPEARTKRLKIAPKKPQKTNVTSTVYIRNPDVVIEVLRRANGVCEKCHKDAPFIRKKDNTPYLEVHHKIQLAHGGEDTVENAEALCPNCHREAHFG